MLPGARAATAKAAAAAAGKLATRPSPGEKNGRKRMAQLACVYDAVPVPRAPEDIISMPAQKRREESPGHEAEQEGKAAPAAGTGKWLTASVTDDIPAVIAAAFDEAGRRDPRHQRDWAVLIHGNNTRIETATARPPAAASPSRSSSISSTSLNIRGRPPGRSSTKASPPPRNGSLTRPARSCTATPRRSRPGSAAVPPPTATRQPSAPGAYERALLPG